MRVVCVRVCECVGSRVFSLLSFSLDSRFLSLFSFPTPHPFSPLLSLCVSISVPSRTRPSLSGRVSLEKSRRPRAKRPGLRSRVSASYDRPFTSVGIIRPSACHNALSSPWAKG